MKSNDTNHLVSLSRATTKGKEGKSKLIEQIRECFDEYKFLYVFSIENMRTSMLKEVRAKWISSR